MKIKDIRQYRTFYKINVRKLPLPDRDEHFMGTYSFDEITQKKLFGWFDIYHGDKEGYGKANEGIGNFLQSFLDMAKDGQAVYEFLQNAVDAGSTHFTMVWGKDEIDGNNYLFVANNGEMFNFDSVRSILNVGSSTKTADSKNIGKFGIGFKLAHRLVGKENGLDELLSSEPAGPILFSWSNYELAQLAGEETPEPTQINFQVIKKGKYEILDSNPWLFKILLTCFPVLPDINGNDEEIKLSDGKPALNPVFRKEEYKSLCRWVKNYLDILDREKYKKGALFFIKLGAGKENDLADKNLNEGVRFSLAILQETSENKANRQTVLDTVQLNRNNPIKRPDLNYLYFKITKNENLSDYLFVRFGIREESKLSTDQRIKLKREDDIEVLFGFRNYDEIKDYFRGAPNFYLYFPLSEEVHNFNFVLHSNAFYKASSRTFLHKGTVGEEGINERLLRTIAKYLEIALINLSSSENVDEKNKFLHLYASLLTSRESNNYDRQWIRQPFIETINQTLKKLIPYRPNFETSDFSIAHTQVKIKKTAIELDPNVFGLSEIKWFYWGSKDFPEMHKYAIEKLGLLVFDIFILLQRGNVANEVNKWIQADRSRIRVIFRELNYISDPSRIKTITFKENLSQLKLFEFDDGPLLSINEVTELQEQGYLILHNKLSSIQDELQKCCIKTSTIDLDDYDFYQNYNSYFSSESQLRSQPTLIKIFSNCQNDEVSNQFTPDEKYKIFCVFRDMIEEGKRIERLKELKLFTNRLGSCIEIKHILLKGVKSWLDPFCLNEREENPDLDRYLAMSDKQIYEYIIYKFWKELGNQITKMDNIAAFHVLNDIEDYYLKSELARDFKMLLSQQGFIFYQGEFVKINNPFYHKKLTAIPDEKFYNIQSVLRSKLGKQIPDKKYLEFYTKVPFKLPEANTLFDFTSLEFTFNELDDILQFLQYCGFGDFDNYHIRKKDDNNYLVVRGTPHNYYTSNEKINKYIIEHFNGTLLDLPVELSNYSQLFTYQSEKLIIHLIDSVDSKNGIDILQLTEAILDQNDDLLIRLINKYLSIILDFNWQDINGNEIQLKLIKRLISNNILRFDLLQEKIILKDLENVIYLKSVDSANDEVNLNYRNKIITVSRTLLLGLEDDKGIKKLTDFAREAEKRGILSEMEAKQIFKIHDTGITNELIEKFNNSLSKCHLKNGHQLAFVAVCERFKRDKKSNYQVLNMKGVWQPLSGNWVLPNTEIQEYYSADYVLAEIYKNLPVGLDLTENEIINYGLLHSRSDPESEDLIMPGYIFKKGCSSKILNPECEKARLLKHIHLQWIKTPLDIRIDSINQSWNSVFGFDPTKKIISGPVLREEILDDDIQEFINEDFEGRWEFIKAIGIQTDSSNVVKLRNWLTGKLHDDIDPSIIEQIPDDLLSNTLVGFADGSFLPIENNCEFLVNSKRFHVIIRLIQKLIALNGVEVRFPVFTTKDTLRLGNETGELPKFINHEDYSILLSQCEEKALEDLFRNVQVIFNNDLYKEFVEDVYDELKIDYLFSFSSSNYEHDEPFYRTWREKNNIRLIRTPSINYEVSVRLDDGKIELGEISRGEYYLNTQKESEIIYYKEKLNWELLSDSLGKDGHEKIQKQLIELINNRNRTLAAFYNTLTASGRDNFDSEDTKRILESFKVRDIEHERTEIIETLQTEVPYSYLWFEKYIKYLVSFENIAETISQKSISFQKIKALILDNKESNKYFVLEGANSLIPVNIEIFEDFSINLIFGNQKKENIVVEGVSKKGQDLLIYVPKTIDPNTIQKFNSIVNVSISFSPVLDLVKRLYSAFTNQSILTPWAEIKESAPPIHFIYGPPGTGKTTRLCEILDRAFDEQSLIKVLVLVPTNKAGDVMAKKIFKRGSKISVVRVNSVTDPELEEMSVDVYQPSLNYELLSSYDVIISTVHRLPYYQIANEQGPNLYLFSEELKWDYVIFDESSMISLPYLVFAMMAFKLSNPQAKIIIAGDPKQIPPVEDTSDKDLENLNIECENIYKMFGINSFLEKEQEKIVRTIDTIENLKIQFRSVSEIGQLYSSFVLTPYKLDRFIKRV